MDHALKSADQKWGQTVTNQWVQAGQNKDFQDFVNKIEQMDKSGAFDKLDKQLNEFGKAIEDNLKVTDIPSQ